MNPANVPTFVRTRARVRCSAARTFTLATACLLASAAQAAWMVDTTSPDTVNLTFMAWDNNGSSPKVVFVKDLGKSMTNFFTAGQVDTGTQLYWYLGGTDDPIWTSFLGTDVSTGVKPDINLVNWAVFAMAQPGGPDPTPGSYQIYTTNLQGTSGDAAVIPGISTVSSDALTNSATALAQFYGGNTSSGTLGGTANGSAVLLASDGSAKFPWDPLLGLGSGNQLTYGGTLARGAGNLVGKSSWFYYVTGGSVDFDPTVPVLIDEFDNLTADGYWGLAAASATDKAGQYFLSYNLNGSVTTLEAQSHILSSNNFARLAGVLSLSSSAGKGATVLNMAESFLRGFSKVAAALPTASEGGLAHALSAGDTALDQSSPSPVPEVGSAALMAAGLAGLAGLKLRRRRTSAHG